MTNLGSFLRIAFLMAAGLLTGAARQQAWTFDDDATGTQPAGFDFEVADDRKPGDWQVVDDEGNHVLAQLDRTRDHHRFALAVVKDSSLRDVKVSVRMKAVEGEFDQTGGVMWRYRNSGNYLVARLDVLERNIRLYRFVDGNRVQFGVKENLEVKKGAWHTLRVEHRDAEVKVYLDGEALMIEQDQHFREPGKIGLWAKADSVLYFDNLRATDLADRQDDDNDDGD